MLGLTGSWSQTKYCLITTRLLPTLTTTSCDYFQHPTVNMFSCFGEMSRIGMEEEARFKY